MYRVYIYDMTKHGNYPIFFFIGTVLTQHLASSRTCFVIHLQTFACYTSVITILMQCLAMWCNIIFQHLVSHVIYLLIFSIKVYHNVAHDGVAPPVKKLFIQLVQNYSVTMCCEKQVNNLSLFALHAAFHSSIHRFQKKTHSFYPQYLTASVFKLLQLQRLQDTVNRPCGNRFGCLK